MGERLHPFHILGEDTVDDGEDDEADSCPLVENELVGNAYCR